MDEYIINKRTEKRILEMYFGGYTVQRIVNELQSDWNVGRQKRLTKSDVRLIVEQVLSKIKWEDNK